MATENERLRKARELAGFTSPTDAARTFNWPVSTYLCNENGSRGISKKNAPKYARAFKVSSDWLLYEKGAMRAGATVPLDGYIGAGDTIMPVDDHPNRHAMSQVAAPPEMGPDTVAYEVRGDSQWPAFSDGDLVYADKKATLLDDAIGHLCVVMTNDGTRMLKMVRRGTRKGRYFLLSINAVPIDDVQLEWAALVTWIKKRP